MSEDTRWQEKLAEASERFASGDAAGVTQSAEAALALAGDQFGEGHEHVTTSLLALASMRIMQGQLDEANHSAFRRSSRSEYMARVLGQSRCHGQACST